MNFYKLYDVECDLEVYVNPKSIEYYVYNENSVEINLYSKEHIYVDKSGFEYMLDLEGAREYWNTQHTTE